MFKPRFIQEGHAIAKNARKMLRYRRDLLSPKIVSEIETQIKRLGESVAARDENRVRQDSEKLEKLFSKHLPMPKNAGWRENCEVFLVAIVIAIGVRSYFLQPFTIPTGSMQPTLNGVIAHPTQNDPPNLLVRAFQYVWLGRTWVDVVAKENETVIRLEERRRFRFFASTIVQTEKRQYVISGPIEPIVRAFNIRPGVNFQKGEPMARGYVETGDHVFVDKISYNFVHPSRGDVFVFKTTGISKIEALFRQEGSQYYIKRLAGLPGDQLRIAPPNLFIDGKPATEFGLKRVASARNGYNGYSNQPGEHGAAHFPILGGPDRTFDVPANTYFALGDNSYHSFDSRGWGTVPERNVTGRGMLVYWPFTSHWGLIR
jgi:signal peptidase I